MTRKNSLPLIAKTILLTGLCATALAACAQRHDPQMTAGIRSDFKRTHPITISEDAIKLQLMVPHSAVGLPFADRRRVENFSRDFVNSKAQMIEIRRPAMSSNTYAIDNVMPELVTAMQSRGVQKHQIVFSEYHMKEGETAGLLEMSYVGLKASVKRCGKWKDDMTMTQDNRNYGNFGCASQANLAAQISDPRDLVTPRAMESIDAQQRSGVLNTYSTGSASQ